MKLQDLHVEPLFESEFVLVANRARIGNGTVRLASLQHEQWCCRRPIWATTANC